MSSVWVALKLACMSSINVFSVPLSIRMQRGTAAMKNFCIRRYTGIHSAANWSEKLITINLRLRIFNL